MKKAFLLPAAGAVGIFLAACLSAPDEPTGSGASAVSCTAAERSFNGGCHAVCTSSADCTKAGDSCQTVAEGLSLCLDYKQCGYFASDTACAGVPYGSAYTSYSGEDPYWTPDPDPNPYYTGYGGVTPYGCSGNAPFHVAPPVAGDDPKCGEKHDVVRCEKVGNRCALVSGSTIDVAER